MNRGSVDSGGAAGAGRGVILRRSAAALALILFLLLPALAPAELIDRVLAAVNNEVITLSDLRQAMAFNAAMGARDSGTQAEAGTLEGLVNRKLFLQEAARLRFDEVSDQDVAGELAAVRRQLGTDDAYRQLLDRMQVSEEQFGRMVRQRLMVERFLQKKIGLFARATREEAQEYYTGHPEQFKGRPFPEVQEGILAVLSEQKAGQQLDRFIDELRGRAVIRMNPLGSEGLPPGHGG